MYNVLIYVYAYKILSDSFFYYLTFAGTKLDISDYYSYIADIQKYTLIYYLYMTVVQIGYEKMRH